MRVTKVRHVLAALIFLLHCSLLCGVGHKQRLNQRTDEDVGEAIIDGNDGSKRRGGHKQRRLLVDSDTADCRDLSDLPFNRALVRDWAKGSLSTKQVQQYAMDAMEQGANGLDRFARMGNNGRNPQDLFKAMRSTLGIPAGAPEMDWFEIPTKKSMVTPHPFLLPHRFFSAFYSGRGKRDWTKHITGPKHACSEFWDSIRVTSFVSQHPNLAESTWQYTVPLGMHADAGAFSKQDSIYVFSFNSLVGRGSTHQKRFIFTVVKKSLMLPNTMDEILRIFAWSCNVLLSGVTPHENPYGKAVAGGGQALAGPWRAALCQVRGDWAFFKECFNFPQWNSAVMMCFCCRASSTIPNLAWTNFSPSAGWRDTIWTHDAYLAYLLAQGLPVPILLSLVIGLRLESVMIDVLHTVDLGIAAHIIGNILFIYGVLRGVFGGGTYAERAEALGKALSSWYKRTKCASRMQGALTVERLRASGDWPKLKAKAAAVRHLAKFALFVVEEHADGTDHDNLVRDVAGLLVTFYNILESESQFMSESARTLMPKIGQALAAKYDKLAKLALHQGSRLWKLTPKLHLFEHLAEMQSVEFGNPRWWWTYADEDLVGLIIDIAEGCHPNTMPVSVLFKWLHSMFVD